MAAFATLEERWGSLNVLVNTVGPAAGRFEQLNDADWVTAFQLGGMARGPLRAGRPATAAAGDPGHGS